MDRLNCLAAMTRRRFYAPPEAFELNEHSVTLSADETQHLRNVLRLKTGDEVYVFDGAGGEYRGEIKAIARDQADIQLVEDVKPPATESPLHLTMAVALLKGDKFDLVAQKLTELGVNRIVPVSTARADVRIRNDADADRKLGRWQRIVMEATKQCGRARLMEIELPITFDQFITTTDDDLRLMFAEGGGAPFADAVATSHPPHKKVTALVGSKGGWTGEEMNQALEAGWRIVTLGGRIMRAETAAIACAAMLQHRLGDLN
jgi:16S rRNA (uracil1498-N3)-methyltransferase